MIRHAQTLRLSLTLRAVAAALRLTAWQVPAFRPRLERRLVVLVTLRDQPFAHHFVFGGGRVRLIGRGHDAAHVHITFKDTRTALKILNPRAKRLDVVNAMKTFKIDMTGDDEDTVWFTDTMSLMASCRWEQGVRMPNGEVRYCNATNGGPVFVYVRDGRIVRMTPIEFDDEDPQPWKMEARGRILSPPRRTTVAPHTLVSKSMVYSKDRLLYPMRRVDFDPNGERNPQNRGTSGHVRISWDEALDIVASEIRRVRREHGQGAIMNSHSSHHTWGNIGGYFSAHYRFMNALGYTKMVINPDSWEGWYWGAVHHYGYSMRLGAIEPYGQLEDCLKEAEMIVFWSSDPEATGGSYGAFEATQRRLFARDLGIEMVHIDPYHNHTAALLGGKWIPIRPGTSPALAHAIAHVWITEGLYDKDYVGTRTTGFDRYADYVMGREDNQPKSPEWQEAETGVPAHIARALARKWGSRKTYLAAGGKGSTFGGACRNATGSQWARAMVCLMAMQGLGKPGVNFGNLQNGAPTDPNFYFPGYGDGGMSGDLEATSGPVQAYQRQPQLPSINTVAQKITRNRIPEALLEGRTEAHPIDPKSIQGQFGQIRYPAPGHSRVRMMYKYGGSHFGTTMESNRLARAYRVPELEFVVNQSIWNEGEVRFADIILPACTNFERTDIGEWSVAGNGYSQHNEGQLNYRVISMQHKCIEPLGESRSDFQIFLDLSKRLGLSSYFAEGKTELDWCRSQFEASDLPEVMSWKKFLKRGYYVVPPDPVPAPVGLRWFAEGRRKDVPELHPLPGGYAGKFREGLQTQSGKFEFEPESLKRFDDPGRPAVNRYIPAWEGLGASELTAKYPLQLISPHPRYSFHTQGDGKDSCLNDIPQHRVLVDGHYYWVARIHPQDAAARGITHHALVQLFNDRGTVICAAELTERIRPGVVHAYESSAVYDPIGEPGASPDRGGCVNILTPKRWQTEKTSASAPNSCLIEVAPWAPASAEAAE